MCSFTKNQELNYHNPDRYKIEQNHLLVVVADVVVSARAVTRVGIIEAPAVADRNQSASLAPHTEK